MEVRNKRHEINVKCERHKIIKQNHNHFLTQPTSKKAISLLISYVLLISLTIAMAGAVYVWLKSYVKQPIPEESCPEGVSLIIQDYKCNDPSSGALNLTIKNKGTFRIDGYIIKMNNESSGIAGRYPLCTIDSINNYISLHDPEGYECSKIDLGNQVEFAALDPGKTNTTLFNYTEYGKIRQIEILPMRNNSICSNRVISQPLVCDIA